MSTISTFSKTLMSDDINDIDEINVDVDVIGPGHVCCQLAHFGIKLNDLSSDVNTVKVFIQPVYSENRVTHEIQYSIYAVTCNIEANGVV